MVSYSSHARYYTLHFLKKNRIIVIGMHAHNSHIMQPLDVLVFSSFNSYVNKAFYRVIRTKKIFDSFDMANFLSIAYQSSHNINNTRNGFQKSETWNFDEWAPSVATLKQVLQLYGDSEELIETLSDILSSFETKFRTLVAHADIDVSESGTLCIQLSSTVHYTVSVVLQAPR